MASIDFRMGGARAKGVRRVPPAIMKKPRHNEQTRFLEKMLSHDELNYRWKLEGVRDAWKGLLTVEKGEFAALPAATVEKIREVMRRQHENAVEAAREARIRLETAKHKLHQAQYPPK